MNLRLITKYLAIFIVLLLLQGIVLNNIAFSPFHLTPFLYVIFILALPPKMPSWGILILSFIYGLCLDVFASTYGMHAAACTAMAFFRPIVLRLIAPRDGYESSDSLSIKTFGPIWFFRYVGLLVLVHHMFYFILDAFSFTYFFFTLAQIILNTILTTTFIILTQIFAPIK